VALKAEDEHLKIELWLRWQPDTSRELRLWASSYAAFSGWQAARTVRIDSDAGSACRQAFIKGGVYYEDTPSQDTRWRTVVGIPLEPHAEANLVVGAIVIASRNPPDQSCLGEQHRRDHMVAFRTLLNDVALLTQARP